MEVWSNKIEGIDYVHFKEPGECGKSENKNVIDTRNTISLIRFSKNNLPHQEWISGYDA